jgi:hypothetical protein
MTETLGVKGLTWFPRPNILIFCVEVCISML